MPKDRESTTKRTPRVSRRKACFFDANKMEPSYLETAVLKKFLTERGKIVPAAKSGVCAKHQRLLSREIKRSRQVGLLPFTDR
jgi:small subunit ribosomal protein S18